MAQRINARLIEKHGTETSIPTLLGAQLYLCTDTDKVYKGTEEGKNKLVSDIQMTKQNKVDIDEIKENMPSKNTSVSKTTQSYQLYVNPDGLDSNTGLSAGTPLRTLQKAIDLIPQVVNHTVEIILAKGTYAEDVVLNGFTGKGGIKISGADSVVNAQLYAVSSIQALSCSITIVVSGVGTYTNVNHGFVSATSMNTTFLNCTCSAVSSGYAGFCGYNGGYMCVTGSTANNRASAIFVTNGTLCKSDTNGGSNNTVGLHALSGVIMKRGAQPTGTTGETQLDGGVIR